MKNKHRITALLLAGALTTTLSISSFTTAYAASTPPEKPGETMTQEGGAPEMPSGEAPSGEMPDGEAPDGMPGGEAPEGMGEPPEGMPGEGGGMGGANTQTYDYTGTLSGALTADGTDVTSDGESISATETDQNALLTQNGGTLTVTDGTITKTGSDENGDNCNFYGINSILLSVGEGSITYISDSSLSADSTGSNAIFATDYGTVYSNSNTIETTADNSRGLDATYSGTIIANDMTISTQGAHSAAVATDRGGGSISLTNSTLSTGGSGSPLLYSTGNIQVDNVTGTATGSQIAGMEGLNTILIYNSDLTSTLTKATASDPIADGIIIYQSTSGDAETSTGEAATFQAVNSTLTSAIESGSMFYVTNTTANILLSGTTLNFDSDAANLLQIEGNDANSWGTPGSNGGVVTFTALGETLEGDISVDTISSLDLYLLDGTTYTGAMFITENAVNTNQTESPITVNLSSDSTWVVTEDTTITNLNAEDGASIVDENGKTVSIVANGTTVVEGDSDVTVTLTGFYGTVLTLSAANEISTDYIDREEFDAYYSVSTGFGGTEEASANAEVAEVSTTDLSLTTDTEETSATNYLAWAIGLCAVALLGVLVGIFTLGKKKLK